MATLWREMMRRQYGAAIDTLENTIRACPPELWGDRSRQPEYWYTAYHTLFFIDFHLSPSPEGFAPPAPFTLDELDPAGVVPETPYTKGELLAYVEHGRRKCQTTLDALTDEKVRERCAFPWGELPFAELLLDNMRHVQEHGAQLNMFLGQRIKAAPHWVAKSKREPAGE